MPDTITIRLNTKTRALIILVVLIALFAAAAGARAIGDRPNYYKNCADARAHHDTNIPRSSVYYRPGLDRDNDGYACEG